LLLVVTFTIHQSSQSIYLVCSTDKKDAKCATAYYIQKSNSEIFLTPNIARDKVEVVYVSALHEKTQARKNNLTTFPYELIVEFPNMKKVSISSYAINTMVFDDSMWQIEDLVLAYNNITSFKSTLTRKNSEISYLALVSNPIKTIDSDSFANMFDMRGLYLYNNKISTIHHEAFKDMPVLKYITLSGNQLTSLSIEFIKSLSPDVVHLNLQTNQITELPESIFEKFNNFSFLNLGFNKLTFFDATLLKLSSVEILHLSWNVIKSLNLQGVKNLDIFDVSSNNLNSFNASEIGITSCRHIDVMSNKIEIINLTGVENMKIVKMAKNNLTTISKDMFPENFKPTKIFFESNQIKSIEKGFITTLGKQFVVAFINNPCAILMNPQDWESVSLDSCFKTFDKEIALKKLTVVE
jgi:Leucine-rich repeat (LRR) protein